MSGRGNFTHGGKTRFLPTELCISDRVQSFHLAGISGTCVIGNAGIREAVKTMRPTFVVIDLGTNDLAHGSPAPTVAD